MCLFCILVAACRSVNSVLQKQLTEEKDKKEQILTERDRLSQVKNSDIELIFPYGWHLDRVWSGEFCVLLLRRMKPEKSFFFQWKLSLIKIHVWIIVTVPKMSHILDWRITSICIHILRYLCPSSLVVVRSLSLFFSSLNCQNLNELKEERKKFLQILSNKVNIRLRIYESHIFELQI